MTNLQKIITINLVLFLSNCSFNGYNYPFDTITNYNVNINKVSPDGIQVDDERNELNLLELDRQTNALEKCLGITIYRTFFKVKVAPDWYISKCSGQQLFPCDDDGHGCEDKDLPITEECPCNCRARIQNNNIIVVTPNLLLYRAELARMVTKRNNPWSYDWIRKCLLDRGE